MGHIIATANMKGGVGKTTLTVNLATALVKNHNKRVLVVDLDTQISATLSMLSPADFAKIRGDRRTLRSLVHQAIKPEQKLGLFTQDVVRPYMCTLKGLELLPGDIDLYDEFLVSETLHKRASQGGQVSFDQVWRQLEKTMIKSILQPVLKEYDFIILDCAPGYNLLTRSALIASDYYVLPARPEPLSVVGIQLLERRIAKLRETYENDVDPLTIQMLGIVFTMSGNNLLTGRYYQQVMKRVLEDYGAGKIFKTRVPVDVNVSKAVDQFMPVVLTHPTTSGAQAFAQITQEFLQKLEVSLGAKQQKSKMSLVDLE